MTDMHPGGDGGRVVDVESNDPGCAEQEGHGQDRDREPVGVAQVVPVLPQNEKLEEDLLQTEQMKKERLMKNSGYLRQNL